MLEKVVGDNLKIIGRQSFEFSHFLTFINVKNVVEIGDSAFFETSLKAIKNKKIPELKNYEFWGQVQAVQKMKMKSLNKQKTVTFVENVISEHDVFNITTVPVQDIFVKNFKFSP